MAKQFSVIISGNEYLFPSASVMMVSTMSGGTTINFRNTPFAADYSIEDLVALANDGGVEQVQVSVIRVNDSVQVNIIPMSFPVGSFTVNDSTLSGSNAVIIYLGVRYYVSETQIEILDAANAGGGGGDPTLNEVIVNGNVLTGAKVIDATDGGLTISGALVLSGGADCGAQNMYNIFQVRINANGALVMTDTVTQEVVNITVADGVFVIQAD